jgi:hydrogenase expression/formation protein HypD
MIRYVDEFRKATQSKAIVERITKIAPDRTIRIMEVCGGHTHTIHKFGIEGLLPESIELISGPGCPVCVTPQTFIDTAIEIARIPDTIVTTFGDMIRVPGSRSSLLSERTNGRDVRVCLSTDDALCIARDNPGKRIVFLGIGFETTAPSIAASIECAAREKIKNYSVLCGLKTMPAALAALASSDDVAIDGLICPGHVTAITGTDIYAPLAETYGLPCAVSGFEPTDVLRSIEMLVRQIAHGIAVVENEYVRVVLDGGNPTARALLARIFEESTSAWRGLGDIPGSGLAIIEKFADYDASRTFDVTPPPPWENRGCECGLVMTGKKRPEECPLFARACTPENPLGACMVSGEGACGIHFMYGGLSSSRNPRPRR